MPLGKRRKPPTKPDVAKSNGPVLQKATTASGRRDRGGREAGEFKRGNQLAVARPPAGLGKKAGFAELALRVQERTAFGRKLIDFAVDVFEGRIIPSEAQLKMLNWLSDRGFGKVLQSVELQAVISKQEGTGSVRPPIERLAPDEQEKLYEMIRKMEGRDERPVARMLGEATVKTVVEGVLEGDKGEEEEEGGERSGETNED